MSRDREGSRTGLVRDDNLRVGQGAFVVTRVAEVVGPVTAYYNQ